LPSEDADATTQSKTTALTFIAAAAGSVEQTDVSQTVKEGIDTFFDAMPVFMDALDAVAALHPFIGGSLSL
jgi:hypothetical protein